MSELPLSASFEYVCRESTAIIKYITWLQKPDEKSEAYKVYTRTSA